MAAAPPERDGILARAAFAAAALPVGGFVVTLTVYLPNYYTRVLGLPLALVGVVFAAVRLADIAFDPLLGLAIDATRSRAGRFRPWLVAAAPVLMMGTAAVYFPQHAVSGLHLFIWLVVFFAGYSMLVLAQAAWGAALVVEYHGRSRLYGLIQAVGVTGSLAVLVVPPLLAKAFPHLPIKGVPLMGAFELVAVPLCVSIAAGLAREPPSPPRRSGPALSWRDYAGLLARPTVLRILLADLCLALGPAITAPLYLFFFELARGYSAAQADGLLMIYIVAGVPGPSLWARVAHRLGKHRTVRLASATYAILQVGLLALPAASPGPMVVAMFLVGFTATAFPFLTRAMLADAADELRCETGADRTALLYALIGCTSKIGATASVGIAYSLLPLFGFKATLGLANTPFAIWGLQACYLVPPILAVLLGGLAVWGYRLDAVRHAEIRAALRNRDGTG